VRALLLFFEAWNNVVWAAVEVRSLIASRAWRSALPSWMPVHDWWPRWIDRITYYQEARNSTGRQP